MKNIFKLLLLIFALPLIAFAVDSYNYDRSINIPSAAVGTSENSPAGNPETTGGVGTGTADGENDPGLTYQGTVTISVYSLISDKKYPVNTARVEAKAKVQSGNDTSFKELGNCITGSNGQCQLNLNSPSASLEFTGNETISYTATKGERSGARDVTFANSKDKVIDIQIEGLSKDKVTETQDWTREGSASNYQIPTADGFIGGAGSIIVIPTRYTMVGGTQNKTPVGGVTFSLQIYYDPNIARAQFKVGDSADGGDPKYQSPADAFFYTTQNTLSSVFGSFRKYPYSGVLPDNGINSQIEISNLPAGYYFLKLDKDGYQATTITFELRDGESKALKGINLRPRGGAEPPSINQKAVRKLVDMKVYWVNISGTEYMYMSEYPWYGWQTRDNYITQEPTYSVNTGYEPRIPIGSQTTGGYDVPWETDPGDYAEYMRRCQNMSFGQGIDPENAAIAAGIAGLGNWLGIDDREKNLGTFAETTLIPGLTTYFAARAMQDSGGSLSISTGNADCYPDASPYGSRSYSPYSTQRPYTYPNGYPTRDIPSECYRCLSTPPTMYDPNWCPSYCQDYLGLMGSLPVLDYFPRF